MSRYHYVLAREGVSKVLPEDEFESVRALERDGWKVLFDSAPSIEAGRAYAARFARALPDDLSDAHRPRRMTAPTVLYRSVSNAELSDIAARGTIQGRGNVFNPLDPRRFVFLAAGITPMLIEQGEDIGRQVETSLATHPSNLAFKALVEERRPLWAECAGLVEDALRRRHARTGEPGEVDLSMLESVRHGSIAKVADLTWGMSPEEPLPRCLANLRRMANREADLTREWRVAYKALHAEMAEAREGLPFTSAILETVPLSHGFHYSKAFGGSGMGDEDEFGFYPESVALSDLTRIHVVRLGAVVETLPIDAINEVVERLEGRPLFQR